MPVMLVLAVCLLVALALPVASLRPSWRTQGLVVTAGGLAALAVVMTVYVFSEDSYRHDGRSRWAVYDAQAITAVAVAVSILAALVAVLVIRRRQLTWLASLFGVLAVGLNFAALAEMGN